MPGVFTVNSKHTIILSNETLQLCPELKKLTQEQVLYIILAYDYTESPWKRFPLETRKHLAKRKMWGEIDIIPEDFKNVIAGIHEYKGLIYDVEREQRDVLLGKLDSLNNAFNIETDNTRLSSLMKSQDLIQKRIDEVDTRIDIKDEKAKLKAGKKLSLIELFQRNKNEYEEKMNRIMKENQEDDS